MFRLLIKNFQSLEDVDLFFDRGSFVAITGQSDIGKSAIIRALKTIFYNDTDMSYIRHAQAELFVSFSVTDLNNDVLRGDIVHIDITKSKTKNEFRVISRDSKGEFQQKVYPKVGRQTPEEIQNILGFTELVSERDNAHNLHFQTQLESLFLVTQTQTEISSVLNKIFDLDRYEAVLRLVNSDKLADVREHAKVSDSFTKNSIKHEEALEEYTREKDLLDSVQEKYQTLESLISKRKNLIEALKVLGNLNNKKVQRKDLNIQKEIYETISTTLSEESVSLNLFASKILSLIEFKNKLSLTKGYLLSYTEDLSFLNKFLKTSTEVSEKIYDNLKLKQTVKSLKERSDRFLDIKQLSKYIEISTSLVKLKDKFYLILNQTKLLKEGNSKLEIFKTQNLFLNTYVEEANRVKELANRLAQSRIMILKMEGFIFEKKDLTKKALTLEEASKNISLYKQEIFVLAGKCPLCLTTFDTESH